jgi:hypothetical protein
MKIEKLNLHSCAMIVEFNASQWTARKLDRKVTDEVIADKNAKAASSGRFNKNLFAGRSELEDIGKHVTMVRNYVVTNTLPWSDNGQRLLPAAKFLEFDKKMSIYKEEFEALVDSFVSQYPTLITAQAMSLGDMFDRADFPPASDIARRFGFAYDYLPVPAAGDFRVDIGNTAQDELQTRLLKSAQTRVDAAMDDLSKRLTDHLKRMSERLVTDIDDKTGEPKHRKFTSTLVTGVYDLCDLVKGLNVTNDPVLNQARRILEETLAGTSAESLRTDPIKRADVKKEVDNLLNKFSFSMDGA